jgi:hypothetical protein
MTARIPQHFIDELLQRADIVELIGSRIQLKKAGREYKACCPFHGEKTPSFTVSPNKGFYHCFGCGAHGTALDFLMEYDRLDFLAAVEELAGSGWKCRGSYRPGPVTAGADLPVLVRPISSRGAAPASPATYLGLPGLDGETTGVPRRLRAGGMGWVVADFRIRRPARNRWPPA